MKKLTLVSLLLFSLTGCKIQKYIEYPGGSKLYYNMWSSKDEAKFLGDRMEKVGYFKKGRDYKVEIVDFFTYKYTFSTKIPAEDVDILKQAKSKYAMTEQVVALKKLMQPRENSPIFISFELINKKTNKTEIVITGDPRSWIGADAIIYEKEDTAKDYWPQGSK